MLVYNIIMSFINAMFLLDSNLLQDHRGRQSSLLIFLAQKIAPLNRQIMKTDQGRETRQNSGGVADLTKGGLQKILHELRDKNMNFLEVLR